MIFLNGVFTVSYSLNLLIIHGGIDTNDDSFVNKTCLCHVNLIVSIGRKVQDALFPLGVKFYVCSDRNPGSTRHQESHIDQSIGHRVIVDTVPAIEQKGHSLEEGWCCGCCCGGSRGC